MSLADPNNAGVYALFLRSGFLRCLRAIPRVPGDRRATGAAVLRHYRSHTTAAQRREQIAKLREIAPLGMSAYRIRMGYDHA